MILLQVASVQAQGLDVFPFLAQNPKGLEPFGFVRQ
jgi:hypothetical protein